MTELDRRDVLLAGGPRRALGAPGRLSGGGPVSGSGSAVVEPAARRRLLGYVLAAPILVTAAELAATSTTTAPIPSSDVTRLLGLNDIMTAAALPAAGLISVEVSQDGTVSFALPRTWVGQSLTTSTVMLVAEELSVPPRRVHVTLADVGPDVAFNQVTGETNTIISTCTPIRVAAAVARRRLLKAASATLGSPVADLWLNDGVITDGSGRSLDIGALAARAASTSTVAMAVDLTSRESSTVIDRRNAPDAVASPLRSFGTARRGRDVPGQPPPPGQTHENGVEGRLGTDLRPRTYEQRPAVEYG
ncbi:molybdopterin cofactor-binding domain-containing protein [Micromonospora sp. NPDC047467]|uniref:molybdopterin cofactor-binding domain-containing protein n=1 Tax=Micromonospora sp. NPDC047467 TaxID=3154814 RepID=UPI0033D3F9E3